MHSYGVSEVEKLLRLSRATIRSLVAAGFVTPQRGPRNALRFSFRDLIVLRTARALAAAKIPHRRILRALRELRSRLPEEMPLSGLSIGAVADHVVVREGSRHWLAETGQYLLAFEGDPEHGTLRVIEAAAEAPAPADTARLAALERSNAEHALDAYERAVAADPLRLDARINLGRLLHELEHHDDAERTYRDAFAIVRSERNYSDRGDAALLHFNLGVLLDDMDRADEAIAEYENALRVDPELADAHYNLALLYEEQGEARQALRHMSQYRRLTKQQ
ncbi:tetratricopeptide repeat protein [Lysobacter solisilvae (ex Woo and Kim 2020)]|uniref:Tetratricopeptide repeat protein n=1 Tax=Agrilutibacter terrestris TaxID=2865112 RepID=A0A7H0G139_9GAMM|nr:tetratricopeptide repeat protein [Lysobacter terrestris]QNP42005.1 tetratricopeptide repeat protein [Lysobacter terrestris]